MKKLDPGANDQKVMDAMLTMLHSMVTSAEMYYKHKSLSDIGPFTLVINGIKVIKVKVALFVYRLCNKKNIVIIKMYRSFCILMNLVKLV